jgi:predicted nucleic acid-binding protein
VKILADTSVLVAGLCTDHPRFAAADPWLRRAAGGEVALVVSQHSLAELYHVLTALPLSPRISPREARDLIEEGLLPTAAVVSLAPRDYRLTLGRMALLGIGGGAIFDALIARAAEKARADRLLTFDVAHFRRVWPEGADIIASP